MSDFPRDEGISRFLDAAGKDRVIAYGFLMFLLEAIAARMNSKEGHLKCTATYSISHWGRITYSHPNRVRKYLELCKVIGWVQVEFEEGNCKVTIQRMVEWRDEYTRKSGQAPDKVAQSRAEENRTEQRESRQEREAVNSTSRRGKFQSAEVPITGLNQLNKSIPSPSPEIPGRRQSRRNGHFDDVKIAVEKLLSAGVVEPTEIDKIAKLAQISPKQVKEAIKQLREDGKQ